MHCTPGCATTSEPHASVPPAWRLPLALPLLLAGVGCLRTTRRALRRVSTAATTSQHSGVVLQHCGSRSGRPLLCLEGYNPWGAESCPPSWPVLNSTPHDAVWRCLLSGAYDVVGSWTAARSQQTDCLHCGLYVDGCKLVLSCFVLACLFDSTVMTCGRQQPVLCVTPGVQLQAGTARDWQDMAPPPQGVLMGGAIALLSSQLAASVGSIARAPCALWICRMPPSALLPHCAWQEYAF
jgi:hypothetical protein